MAEITKVTTPIVPRENLGKNRPVTEQAFELNNPQKVHKPVQDKAILDRDTGEQALRDLLGRAALEPLLREGADVVHAVQKMLTLLQMGISTSEIVGAQPLRDLLISMFVEPEQLMELLSQQDRAALLFKGETFDVLRDVLARFEDNPQVRDALGGMLKAFEHNVNLQNSLKTILYNCRNILDYMFSKDREQFAGYLEGLGEILLPPAADPGEQGAPAAQPAADTALEPREAAALLKSNLLPLLGEIVIKYDRNDGIRDLVMVVVHNIVRVEKGTPEALREAIHKLCEELGKVANLPDGFERNLSEAVLRSGERAKLAENEVVEKLAGVLERTLHSPQSAPAVLRQAENLLLSLLYNQSSMMNVLHFILPLDTPDGRSYAEMYVDPDSDEHGGQAGRRARKIFLAVESERQGPMELCFLESGERVDFSLWCTQVLVGPLSALRRSLGDIMQAHGYTMNSFAVAELTERHSIVQIFPKLLDRKVGIDVRI